MHKKRALVLWIYLSLLALAACGPKVIDDSDIVSIDYKYTFTDWTLIRQWAADFVMWEDSDFQWLESVVRWAKQDEEFNGVVNGKEVYKFEYDSNKLQAYPGVILNEVMWISEPSIWTEVYVSSIWTWVITEITKDADGYDSYVVDFNDFKTYSDISYYVKITGIEKK